MRVTTRTKLVAAFAAVSLGSAVVGAFAVNGTATLRASTVEMGEHLRQATALLQARESVLAARYHTAKAIMASLEGRHERAETLRVKRDEAVLEAESDLRVYATLPMSAEEKALWSRVEPGFREWVADNEGIWSLVRARDGAQADAKQDAVGTKVQQALIAPLDELVRLQLSDSESAVTDAERLAGSVRRNLLIAIVITISGALALAFALSRSVATALGFLGAEATRLTDAVARGKLGVRADAAGAHFEFRPILEGMNATMDAFVKPIEVTSAYVARISRGDIPPRITDAYEGDFNAIKDSLNGCIEAVAALVRDARALSEAAVEGKLSTRADASVHQGDFRTIVDGVNRTLDAVVGPIEDAATVLERLSARDLTSRITAAYRGDHARIKDAVNATAGALHDALAQVAGAVQQVSSAAGQIAASSQSVADGASEQASSLEETSSQLESMTATTRVATDNATQANGLAQQAKGAATAGAAAMEQMSGAMAKIRESAEGTSQIIKDINEIAFQTNLLALNAAVEAARAGEAGRGFAVVAEEVRSLALRSKEAAMKTEELIRQSVKEASEGEQTSRDVSGKLAQIVTGVTKVSEIVAEIAATAREQAQGIEQVNRAVTQMDKVTQQNAANSEESSSAAQELSSQSEELAAMVGTFRLSAAGGAAAASGQTAVPGTPARGASASARTSGQAPRGGAGRSGADRTALRPEQLIPLDGEGAYRDF